MSNWLAYDGGKSVGKVSVDGAVILRDDEHELGARITLKRSNSFVSVACHIYGRTDHTRFFNGVSDAAREYAVMKTALDHVMNIIESTGGKDIKAWEAISEFVRRFS